jgi:hypothetical protein
MDTNLGIQATTECLKSINNIGSTTWVNVCTKTREVVQWGAGDWIGLILVVIFFLVMVIIFGFLVRWVISDF